MMVPIAACVAEASATYHVEQAKIAAIMANGFPAGVERGGRIGPMGIPLQWLPVFEMMGIQSAGVTNDACQNIFAGTWILAYVATLQDGGTYSGGTYATRPVRISAQVAERRRAWGPTVQRVAALTGVPAALIDAVITVESGYQPRVVSSAKAIGMMQLMPSTAAMLGGDPWDGEQNILMGARYLGQLSRQFNGDLQLILAAYNAGPAAVTRSGFRIPAFTETRAYVPKVLSLYAALQQ
jgi:soluble lytic murein transglycosylase-like protein